MSRLLWGMPIVLLLGIVSSARAVDEKQLPAILQDVRIEQRLDNSVPLDLVFRDEKDQEVRLRDYFTGKPVILVLAYYRCPKLCTMVLSGLLESMQSLEGLELGRDFSVVTVSFDSRETPELAAQKKKAYTSRYRGPGSGEDWHFLTGPRASIDRLTQAVGFYYVYDARIDQFIHASAIMVITPKGRISRYLYGVQYQPRDVRLALVEASANKIGTPMDQVLLFCYQYDPSRGKYSVQIMRLVRVAGALTVVGLVACGGIFWWRQRRRRSSGPGPNEPEPATSDPHKGA